MSMGFGIPILIVERSSRPSTTLFFTRTAVRIYRNHIVPTYFIINPSSCWQP